MNIRTTKIVAPLLAMALCTPNVAFAQEESKTTTISGSTAVNNDFSLTRTISATNRNNSRSQDPKTIYVNPGDTINVKLDLINKKGKRDHGFTSFKEEVSPIQYFSASSGKLTVKKSYSPKPQVTPLNKLYDGTFMQNGERTIEFKAKSISGFGEIGNQVTIDYSYTAANKPGIYQTKFKPDDPRFAEDSFDATQLDLTIVVNSKERPAPPDQDERPAPPDQGGQDTPPDQGGQDTPPDQDEQVIPPKSNRSTGFSWLTKALGVLAFLGGTVWFIIKNIFRL